MESGFGTWLAAAPFSLDRVRLTPPGAGLADLAGNALDGDWADGSQAFPSGDGAAGGDFHFRLDLVRGDADRNGRVDAFDTLAVRAKQGSNAATSPANYSAFHDVDGNGRIDAFDTLGIKAKQGTNFNLVPTPTAGSVFARGR
jgi:hypothetical protein